MNITIFISSLSGGGAERVAVNLANYLVRNNEVTLLTIADDIAYRPDKDVEHISLTNHLKLPKIGINIFRICRFISFILHSPTDAYIVMLPIPTIMLYRVKRLIHVPVIMAERCNPSSYQMWKQRELHKAALKMDGFIFQTSEIADWYKNESGNLEVIIPNAVNSPFLNKGICVEREKIIVSAGRLTEQKNFELLIRAFASISDKLPEYKLFIYGDGPLRSKLENLIKIYGLEQQVFLPGYIEHIEERIYKAALFVLTSKYEGMPNTLMEAMALGVPVISTDCAGGGARYLINNGVNGVLIQPDNESELSSSIIKVLNNKRFAASIAHEGYKIGRQFSPDTIYSRWEEYISYVIGKCEK